MREDIREVLQDQMEVLRKMSYTELLKFLDNPQVFDVGGPAMTYELEVEAFWDSGKRGGNLRVLVAVSNAGDRSYSIMPNDSFIISPEGRFVGE